MELWDAQLSVSFIPNWSKQHGESEARMSAVEACYANNDGSNCYGTIRMIQLRFDECVLSRFDEIDG